MEKVERRIINGHPKDRLVEIGLGGGLDVAPLPDGGLIHVTLEDQEFDMIVSDPKHDGFGTWTYQTTPA